MSTNRDVLLASVKFQRRKDGNWDVTKRNDNDPTVTTIERDNRKTLRLTEKKTVYGKRLVRSRATPESMARWDEWQKKHDPHRPYSLRFGGYKQHMTGLMPGEPKIEYIDEYEPNNTTFYLPGPVVPNPNFQQLGPPILRYTEEARNPGGYWFGIPKTEMMTPSQADQYKKELFIK